MGDDVSHPWWARWTALLRTRAAQRGTLLGKAIIGLAGLVITASAIERTVPEIEHRLGAAPGSLSGVASTSVLVSIVAFYAITLLPDDAGRWLARWVSRLAPMGALLVALAAIPAMQHVGLMLPLLVLGAGLAGPGSRITDVGADLLAARSEPLKRIDAVAALRSRVSSLRSAGTIVLSTLLETGLPLWLIFGAVALASSLGVRLLGPLFATDAAPGAPPACGPSAPPLASRWAWRRAVRDTTSLTVRAARSVSAGIVLRATLARNDRDVQRCAIYAALARALYFWWYTGVVGAFGQREIVAHVPWAIQATIVLAGVGGALVRGPWFRRDSTAAHISPLALLCGALATASGSMVADPLAFVILHSLAAALFEFGGQAAHLTPERHLATRGADRTAARMTIVSLRELPVLAVVYPAGWLAGTAGHEGWWAAIAALGGVAVISVWWKWFLPGALEATRRRSWEVVVMGNRLSDMKVLAARALRSWQIAGMRAVTWADGGRLVINDYWRALRKAQRADAKRIRELASDPGAPTVPFLSADELAALPTWQRDLLGNLRMTVYLGHQIVRLGRDAMLIPAQSADRDHYIQQLTDLLLARGTRIVANDYWRALRKGVPADARRIRELAATRGMNTVAFLATDELAVLPAWQRDLLRELPMTTYLGHQIVWLGRDAMVIPAQSADRDRYIQQLTDRLLARRARRVHLGQDFEARLRSLGTAAADVNAYLRVVASIADLDTLGVAQAGGVRVIEVAPGVRLAVGRRSRQSGAVEAALVIDGQPPRPLDYLGAYVVTAYDAWRQATTRQGTADGVPCGI